MKYGERLQLAMDYRSRSIGRAIGRLELSRVAGCTRQNVGMILTNAKGIDQKFSAESHAKVAGFLRVNPDWLLNETGDMAPVGPHNVPDRLTSAAIELACLFDMIPESETFARNLAYNQVSEVLMKIVESLRATPPSGYGLGKLTAAAQR